MTDRLARRKAPFILRRLLTLGARGPARSKVWWQGELCATAQATGVSFYFAWRSGRRPVCGRPADFTARNRSRDARHLRAYPCHGLAALLGVTASTTAIAADASPKYMSARIAS
jgi:hypothetical protein